MQIDRLMQQINFIVEIDKLKEIIRRSYITSAVRRENSAEHSWHLAVMAIVLAEHANQPIELLPVLKMLLIHDIVEIDAGDVFLYDKVGNLDKAAREKEAAERLFGLLPQAQAHELRHLWEEFEAHLTPEARFAKSLDRLMPLLHNYHTKGKGWQEHGITSELVLAYNATIAAGSEPLWQFAQSVIQDAVEKGYLSEKGKEK